MNTKLLKQKILDLAIRGKLTQQLKSDGTAADLLTQISDERRETRDERKGTRSKKSGVILSEAQSAKSKDLGRIIPLDKSEAPFEIPANWEWVRLGDVCSKFSTGPFGTMLHKEDYVLEGGVPLVNPTNLQDGVIDSNKIKLVKKEKYESLRPYVLETNDIVLARRGDLSKCAIVSENENLWLAGTGAFFLKLVLVDVNYFIRLYRTSFVQSYLVADSIGSTMDNLNQTTLGNLPIPLPPLAEQQRIVAKIEEAFAEIDSIENNKELLKTHIKQTRQKILDLAIHGKLVPQNKSDEPASVLLERITRDNPHYEKLTDVPFEIPDSWEWTRLGDVCRFIGGRTPDKSNPKYWNGSINWASVKDIKGIELADTVDKITEAGFEDSASSYAEKEDLILVTRINPGMCVQTKIKTAINQDLKVVKVPTQINKVYVMVFCNFAQKWFLEKSSGTTVKGIKIDAVLQMPFPLPPLAEQKRIVDRIEEIFASLDEISLHLI